MKLLYFASDFRIGLSVLLVDELTALHKAGIPLVAVASDKQQEEGLIDSVRVNNIDIRQFVDLDEHVDFRKKARWLAKIIKEENITVVHVQNNWQLVLLAYCRFFLRCKVKIIYTLHGFRHNNPVKAYLAQFIIGFMLLCCADKVRCMCSFLKSRFSFLSYKIFILPLGIAENFYEGRKQDMPTGGIKAVFPAQFRDGKNQAMIIRAFSRFIEKNGDKHSFLVLPGTGPNWDDMKRLVSELGCESHIILPGQCSKAEVLNWYLKCNVAVVASNSETFGQSIVEPFILGRCVLTRKVGVASDIIKNGITGYLFDNENDLYDLFYILGNNPSLIYQCRENGSGIINNFRWGVIASQYKSILAALAK